MSTTEQDLSTRLKEITNQPEAPPQTEQERLAARLETLQQARTPTKSIKESVEAVEYTPDIAARNPAWPLINSWHALDHSKIPDHINRQVEPYIDPYIAMQGVLDQMVQKNLEAHRGGLMFEQRNPQEIRDAVGLGALESRILSLHNGYNIWPEEGQPVVDYTSGVRDTAVQLKMATINSEEEMKRLLAREYGAENVSEDKMGRPIFLDPITKHWTAANAVGRAELNEALSVAGHLFTDISATIGSAYATRGSSLVIKLFGEALALSGARWTRDAVAQVTGNNLETMPEEHSRWLKGIVYDALGVAAEPIGMFGYKFLHNPWAATISKKNFKLIAELEEWDRSRIARGLKPVSNLVNPDVLNESNMLARYLSIFSKFQGGGGVFQKKGFRLEEALNEEIEDILRDFEGAVPDRIELGNYIRDKYKEFHQMMVDNERSLLHLRWDRSSDLGDAKAIGSDRLEKGARVAFEKFHKNAEGMVASLYKKTGDDAFIRPVKLKEKLGEILDELVLDKDGKVIHALNAGESEGNLLSLYGVKDEMSFKDAHQFRKTIGEHMRGTKITAGMSEAQWSRLYKAFNEDMEDSMLKKSSLIPVSVRKDRERFLKEFNEYNEYYKHNHDVFNDSKGALNKAMKNKGAIDLVDSYFNVNSIHMWPEIKKQLSPDTWKEVQEAAQASFFWQANSPGSIQRALDSMPSEVRDIIFEPGGELVWRRYDKALTESRGIVMSRLVTEQQDAETLLEEFITISGKGGEFKQYARDALGGVNSPSWRKIQLAAVEKVIRSEKDSSTLVGKELKTALERNKASLQFILEGSDLYRRLELLADIKDVTNKKVSDASGGLAAGMQVVAALFNPGLALKVAAGSWAVAKVLTSESFSQYITRPPVTASQMEVARITTSILNRFFLNRQDTEWVATGKADAPNTK